MNIHATNDVVRPPHTAPKTQKGLGQPQKMATAVQREPDTPEAASTQMPDKTRGVIRLLEDGHFRGVADVRLRINFFDELSGRARQAAESVAHEGAANFTEVIEGKVDEAFADLDLDDTTREAIDEAIASFNESIQGDLSTFTADVSIDAENIVATFQAHIDTLLASLSDLLIPPTEEQPDPVEPITVPAPSGDPTSEDVAAETTPTDTVSNTNPPEAVDSEEVIDSVSDASVAVDADPVPDLDETGGAAGETEPAVSPGGTEGANQTSGEITDATDVYRAALTSIREAAEAALAELQASLTGALNLGASSEPAGNGTAYEKFLAIYEQLLGGSTSVDEEV